MTRAGSDTDGRAHARSRERSNERSYDAPPENALEALERASFHTRQAGLELLAAARALLDAASLGWSGKPSNANLALQGIAQSLDELQQRLEAGASELPAPIAAALLSALDAEIARWEARSSADPDSRAVLRTFLAVREILFEFGVRHRSHESATAAPTAASPRPPAEPTRGAPEAHTRRVKRIQVEG